MASSVQTLLPPTPAAQRPSLKRSYAFIWDDSSNEIDISGSSTSCRSSSLSMTALTTTTTKTPTTHRPLTRSNAFVQWDTLNCRVNPSVSTEDTSSKARKRQRVDETQTDDDFWKELFEIERGPYQPNHRQITSSSLKPLLQIGISTRATTTVAEQATVIRVVRIEDGNEEFQQWRQRAFKGQVPRRGKPANRRIRSQSLLVDDNVRREQAAASLLEAMKRAAECAKEV
ncbi:hypothetical protein FRC02_006616 [Tulasnella sp. 418]|nr:hypothetical protein FRC02_006616 [Tulasnella sp. 418]